MNTVPGLVQDAVAGQKNGLKIGPQGRKFTLRQRAKQRVLRRTSGDRLPRLQTKFSFVCDRLCESPLSRP